ncbi:hypothetical protein [Spirochaeta lutea]|uniref:Uncharacterized protein n=1 Tax=Spirochaeta lutea TaxID=1480694 RepID=A0A098R0B5_9SPIO|nr:hypothetical protein [Spirochaeta lutea]KGE73133.1 hypothetical protein DC28_04905 [Spirochaeta lutea]
MDVSDYKKQFEALPTPILQQRETEIDQLLPEAQQALKEVLTQRLVGEVQEENASTEADKPEDSFLAGLLWVLGVLTIVGGFFGGVLVMVEESIMAWEFGLIFGVGVMLGGLAQGVIMMGLSKILKNQIGVRK